MEFLGLVQTQIDACLGASKCPEWGPDEKSESESSESEPSSESTPEPSSESTPEPSSESTPEPSTESESEEATSGSESADSGPIPDRDEGGRDIE